MANFMELVGNDGVKMALNRDAIVAVREAEGGVVFHMLDGNVMPITTEHFSAENVFGIKAEFLGSRSI